MRIAFVSPTEGRDGVSCDRGVNKLFGSSNCDSSIGESGENDMEVRGRPGDVR